MFGVEANDNVNGVSTPKAEPAKYVGGVLKSVTFDKPVKDDGTALQKRITFLFEADGIQHTHIEYETKSDDPKVESKNRNLSLRVTHIMSKFYAREQLNVKHASFEEYATWVANMLNGKTASTKIDYIVVGNVYNGKATTGFPGYLPFVVKSGEPLDFDNNHKSSNAAYFSFMSNANATPDIETTSSNTGKAVDSDF